jgi:hypothetical protein
MADLPRGGNDGKGTLTSSSNFRDTTLDIGKLSVKSKIGMRAGPAAGAYDPVMTSYSPA